MTDTKRLDYACERLREDPDVLESIETCRRGFISADEMRDRIVALFAFADQHADSRLEREAELAREEAALDAGDSRADQEREDQVFGDYGDFRRSGAV